MEAYVPDGAELSINRLPKAGESLMRHRCIAGEYSTKCRKDASGGG